jgi:hypothetical protein
MSITPESAVGALWDAFDYEPIKLGEIFDRIAYRLRRNPRFAGMSIAEIDLILADARREADIDVSEYEQRLAQAFEDALAGAESDGVAA